MVCSREWRSSSGSPRQWKKSKKRVWILRLWRLPQLAEERITRTFSLIPSAVRLYFASASLVVLTTFLISQYPLSLMPYYWPGDQVREDVVVPIDLELVRPSSALGSEGETTAPSSASHRQRVVLHAGETVTVETAPVLDAIRRHQLAEAEPSTDHQPAAPGLPRILCAL
jgi:hypothetical protein